MYIILFHLKYVTNTDILQLQYNKYIQPLTQMFVSRQKDPQAYYYLITRNIELLFCLPSFIPIAKQTEFLTPTLNINIQIANTINEHSNKFNNGIKVDVQKKLHTNKYLGCGNGHK